jgi:hypothetical protein
MQKALCELAYSAGILQGYRDCAAKMGIKLEEK